MVMDRRKASRSPAVRIALALGLSVAALQAEAQTNLSAESFVFPDRLARALSGTSTVFSEFAQERRLAIFNDPLRSEGCLCFEKAGRLRWEIVAPYRSIVVSDGKGIAQFEHTGEKWQKLNIGYVAAIRNFVDQLAVAIQGRFSERDKDYSMSVSGGNETIVTLTPRRDAVRQFLKSIDIHFPSNAPAPARVVLTELNGDSTEIRFSNHRPNVRFPPDTFDLAQPAELETVRRALQTDER